MNATNEDFLPIVDVVDSLLRYFQANSDAGLVKDIIRANEPMFGDLFEGFRVLKELNGEEEAASDKMLERQLDQLCHALALFGVNKRFGSLIDLDPNAPQFKHLLDSAYHLSNLLWSASKQSSDEGFASMFQRVAKEEEERNFFKTIRTCLRMGD